MAMTIKCRKSAISPNLSFLNYASHEILVKDVVAGTNLCFQPYCRLNFD